MKKMLILAALLIAISSIALIKKQSYLDLGYIENIDNIEMYSKNNEDFPLQFHKMNGNNYLVDLANQRFYKVDDEFNLINQYEIPAIRSKDSDIPFNYIDSLVQTNEKELLGIFKSPESNDTRLVSITVESGSPPSISNVVEIKSELSNLFIMDNEFKNETIFEDNLKQIDIQNIDFNNYVGIDGILVEKSAINQLDEQLELLFETSPQFINEIPGLQGIKGGVLPLSNIGNVYVDSEEYLHSDVFHIYSKSKDSFKVDKAKIFIDDFSYKQSIFINGNKLLNILRNEDTKRLALFDLEEEENISVTSENERALGVFNNQDNYYVIVIKDSQILLKKIENF